MSRIIMTSWVEGLQKVSLTKLQMEILGIGLKEAKENVDLLLDGQQITLEVSNIDVANLFQKNAQELGAVVIIKL